MRKCEYYAYNVRAAYSFACTDAVGGWRMAECGSIHQRSDDRRVNPITRRLTYAQALTLTLTHACTHTHTRANTQTHTLTHTTTDKRVLCKRTSRTHACVRRVLLALWSMCVVSAVCLLCVCECVSSLQKCFVWSVWLGVCLRVVGYVVY